MNSCTTELATLMFLFHAINDQIAYWNTLLTQQLEISFRFANTHRFRNSHERKPRLILVVKQRADRFDSLADIAEEKINLVRDRFATRKVGHDVPVLVAHQVERFHHAIKNLRQAQ